MSADEMMQRICATFELERKHGGFKRIDGSVRWDARFAMYRHNYRLKQILVDAGLSSWKYADPYEIADWESVFSPIERSLWWDIRSKNLPLWPQFPVGRFFVDFGNPVAKVAIECDGKKWHDAAKDAARDAELAALGWSVHRVPGWLCHGAAPEYEAGMGELELEERQRHVEEKTPAQLIRRVAALLEACQ